MTNKSESHFGHKDYQIVKREILYQGIFVFVRLHLRIRLFNGDWSEVFTREVLERYSAVAVLPYDPVLDRIILIEQFRPGALKDPVSPWQIEIPAGVIEPGETALEVAKREMIEETGCEASNLELIFDTFVTPGGSNEFTQIFYGEVDATKANGIHGLEHEHENIRVLNLTADEALEMLHTHGTKNPIAIIALQWFALNRDRLRKKI